MNAVLAWPRASPRRKCAGHFSPSSHPTGFERVRPGSRDVALAARLSNPVLRLPPGVSRSSTKRGAASNAPSSRLRRLYGTAAHSGVRCRSMTSLRQTGGQAATAGTLAILNWLILEQMLHPEIRLWTILSVSVGAVGVTFVWSAHNRCGPSMSQLSTVVLILALVGFAAIVTLIGQDAELGTIRRSFPSPDQRETFAYLAALAILFLGALLSALADARSASSLADPDKDSSDE